MWTMIILLCVNAVPHDQCTIDAAIQVTIPVERFSTSIGCAVAAMQVLPYAEDADDLTHPRIHCVR